VNRASLPDLPADGHQLKEWRLVDEISCVVLAVPDQVALNGFGINWVLAENLADVCNVGKISFAAASQAGGKFLNNNTWHSGFLHNGFVKSILPFHGGMPQPAFAQEKPAAAWPPRKCLRK
jgi:hypothetical protein